MKKTLRHELPWTKRWPGKPSFKVSFLTPKATRVDTEFAAVEHVGLALQTVLLTVVAVEKPSARFVELLEQLAAQGKKDMQRRPLGEKAGEAGFSADGVRTAKAKR